MRFSFSKLKKWIIKHALFSTIKYNDLGSSIGPLNTVIYKLSNIDLEDEDTIIKCTCYYSMSPSKYYITTNINGKEAIIGIGHYNKTAIDKQLRVTEVVKVDLQSGLDKFVIGFYYILTKKDIDLYIDKNYQAMFNTLTSGICSCDLTKLAFQPKQIIKK